MPAWHMVPFEPGMPIDLRRLRWLMPTGPGLSMRRVFEIFDVQESKWCIKITTEKLLVNTEAPVILIRAWDVFHCPMFGFEVTAIHRALGYPSFIPGHVEFCSDSYLRVVIWTTVSSCFPSSCC